MIHIISSSFLIHFPSCLVFITCLHNSFDNDAMKHILCFVEIHFGRTCKHAHLQLLENNA
jgi:hypothetical protein